MHTKLAGHTPLQDLIGNVINGAQKKLASAQEKTAAAKARPEPVEEEKTASMVITIPDEVEKLACALEEIGDMMKEADSIELGNESRQGGQVLPTQSPTPGKQNYNLGHARNTMPVNQQKLVATKDNPGAATANPTDEARAPGGNGARYPANGPLRKTSSASQSVAEYILAKVAESEQGGEVLSDDKAGNNPKPPSAPARSALQSNEGPVKLQKVDAKADQKRQLGEVLSEPAQKKSSDPVVHNNLRNASKGGVKIAAARAYLNKIAESECSCEGKGECKKCKLVKALESKKDEAK